MSVTTYAILGFAMMLILTAVLVSGKFTPSIPMIVIPIIFAVIMHHSDGSGATTFLIVIPPFLMIYKRLKMRPIVLMCLVSITAGVMNCLPWGGPCGRLAAGFNISATDILVAELPGLVIGLICCFAIALYYARQEKKRGAGLEAGADTADLFSEADKTEEEKALLRPQLFWFNVALIVIVKIQNERLKSYAPTVLTMVSVLFASGVFTGVLNNSPMKDSMVEVVSGILEGSATAHINTVMGFLWGPLSAIGLNHEACAYTIVPMLQSIAADHITPVQAAASYLMTFVPQVFVNPSTAAMYIGLGLAGIDFKDHWKFTFKWVMLICTLCFAGSILVGTIPF